MGPTWESETQGLPASTTQGHWRVSDEGRSVELIFLGGHLIEAGTTFRATWLTPFTSRNERPSFEHSYELENRNVMGKDIKITQSFRFRYKGERWWPWITNRYRLKPGMTNLGGGSEFMGWTSDQVQFEWRWTGVIQTPTYMRGSATLSIN